MEAAVTRRGTRATFEASVGPLVGVTLAIGVASSATLAGHFLGFVGAPVVAICLGLLVASLFSIPNAWAPGIVFLSKRVLQASVVLFGLGLSYQTVVSIGGQSLPVLIGTLAIVLGAGWLGGRITGVDGDLRTLITVGTAICGASAIAATDSVIDADDADVSYSIATIFVFNVAAVLVFPFVGHALGLSQHAFGLWSGTAVNDLSSVVAASSSYGHSAASYGVVVKLARTLAIIPISIYLSTSVRKQAPHAGRRGTRATLKLFPMFLLAFVAAVGLDSVGLVPSGTEHIWSGLSTWSITLALASIGLSARISEIRKTGLRPIAFGAALWVIAAAGSLAIQAGTGTL